MQHTIPFEPGRTFHVYNHATNKDILFPQQRNYYYFLEQYEKYMSSVWNTYAYCLLSNHVHFLIKVKDEDALKNAGIEKQHHLFVTRHWKNFLSGYSMTINKQEGRRGRLFMNITNRKLVQDNGYFKHLIRYIHLNPVHHGFTQIPELWEHNSYHHYLDNSNSPILRKNEILRYFGGPAAFLAFHQENASSSSITLLTGKPITL